MVKSPFFSDLYNIDHFIAVFQWWTGKYWFNNANRIQFDCIQL